MTAPKVDPEKIISRLKFFNYRYDLDGHTLKIFLPMLCYLKIQFSTEKIKMSSHSRIGFRSLPLEYNFLIYALALFALTWYKWDDLNKGVFVLFGIFLIYIVICLIKTESMKSTFFSWIEKDSLNK